MIGAALVGSLVFLAGCDDNDASPSSDSIVGVWQAEKVVMTTLEGARTETKMDGNWTETATFNDNGSWSYAYTYNDRSSSGTGFYTDDGTAIRINGRDSMAYDVDGNRMSWAGSVVNGMYEIIWRRQ